MDIEGEVRSLKRFYLSTLSQKYNMEELQKMDMGQLADLYYKELQIQIREIAHAGA
ncbi:MAG: hypothetical protein PHQ35_09500 [Phycisphaerae bacterium]|nr:hypothetical protein [Phycisphaerae bacterium]MDD5239951.1 hypothetical protein [Candidatus Nanoarchaeia archaeon]